MGEVDCILTSPPYAQVVNRRVRSMDGLRGVPVTAEQHWGRRASVPAGVSSYREVVVRPWLRYFFCCLWQPRRLLVAPGNWQCPRCGTVHLS